MEHKNIYDSLNILNKSNRTIERIWLVLLEHVQQGTLAQIRDYAHNLEYYILMEAVSFLDEYNNGFTSLLDEEFTARIMDVKMIAAPIVKQIDKWEDLENLRNTIVAHPWRDQRNNFCFNLPHHRNFNAPSNMFEFGMLVNLIRYVYTIVSEEFKEEIQNALIYRYQNRPGPYIPPSYTNVNQELGAMVEAVNNKCHDLGKSYELYIDVFDFSEDPHINLENYESIAINNWGSNSTDNKEEDSYAVDVNGLIEEVKEDN